MRTALLVSPHLDDVVFSCGGIATRLRRHGWRVVVATVFTRSIYPAEGFALECQRDKGLPDDCDYMALRRAEDAAAMEALDVDYEHLDLPEAPHRGYQSAAALFDRPRDDDTVAPVAEALTELLARLAPALVLAPQGCGGHVDHVLTIKALIAAKPSAELGFYRDTPYVIRDSDAQPDSQVLLRAHDRIVFPLDAVDLAIKQRAVCCYRSQIGFQFGGADEACAALASLAGREAGGHGHAEALLGETAVLANLVRS